MANRLIQIGETHHPERIEQAGQAGQHWYQHCELQGARPGPVVDREDVGFTAAGGSATAA